MCKKSVPWVICEKVTAYPHCIKSVSAEFKNATWKCQAIYVHVLSEKEDYVSWYVGRIPMTCGDERVVCTYDTNNEYHCGEASKIIQRPCASVIRHFGYGQLYSIRKRLRKLCERIDALRLKKASTPSV